MNRNSVYYETKSHIYFSGSYLSQWAETPFSEDGVLFCSAEAYMMFKKAMLFGDNETAEKVLVATCSRDQKHLGRSVKNFDEKVWNAHKVTIVTKGNLLKFRQNHEIRDKLIATKKKTLVEASAHDKVWGIGLAVDDPRILDEQKWRGQNLLGEVLMNVRSILKDEK